VTSDLRELYQSVILDHNKQPRNFGSVEGANRSADGFNPLCGDKIKVELVVSDDRVEDVAFSGSGCAISVASASLMTQIIKGKKLSEVESLFEGFHDLVTSNPSEPIDTAALGKLAVFGGVREFPVRVKCATLAWHTLKSALDQADEIVKTE
jgi:nitrogen fixation NifU-like protein